MLSIIVVTTDRFSLVARLFTSLSRQTCNDFEILLVYGPAASANTVAKLADKFADLPITSIRSADHCLSRSRNLALAMVKGDIIALADDDCVYEPETVESVCAAFEKLPAASAIMGRSVDIDKAILPEQGPSVRLNYRSIFKDCPSYVHFYKAEAVHAIGGFDEQLGVGCDTPYQSGEETDYALRILAAGLSIMRTPSVIVRHPAVNLRSMTLHEKTRAYAAGRMRILHKNNLPVWFILANIVYPLFRLPVDCAAECAPVIRYRWSMFMARLAWLKRAK